LLYLRWVFCGTALPMTSCQCLCTFSLRRFMERECWPDVVGMTTVIEMHLCKWKLGSSDGAEEGTWGWTWKPSWPRQKTSSLPRRWERESTSRGGWSRVRILLPWWKDRADSWGTYVVAPGAGENALGHWCWHPQVPKEYAGADEHVTCNDRLKVDDERKSHGVSHDIGRVISHSVDKVCCRTNYELYVMAILI
jgi:hypothetical protein